MLGNRPLAKLLLFYAEGGSRAKCPEQSADARHAAMAPPGPQRLQLRAACPDDAGKVLRKTFETSRDAIDAAPIRHSGVDA